MSDGQEKPELYIDQQQHWGVELKDEITFRDWFAGMALQALIASGAPEPNEEDLEGQDIKDYLADVAYEYADAMLEARKK